MDSGSEPSVGGGATSAGVHPTQLIVLLLCTLINMLDGYDLLAISFTAPQIAAEWQVAPASLGLVFGIGLVGIATGSFLLSPLADRFGRRPTILLGLALITIGMIAVPLASQLWQLGLLRFVTGLGIGTLLASINTIVAEYAPARWRGLAISIYSTGYPIGATLSGSIAYFLLEHSGWRSVYLCGGIASLMLIPIVAVLLPESLAFQMRRSPAAAEQARRSARKLGLVLLETPAGAAAQKPTPLTLFKPELLARTMLVAGAFFMLWITSFFVQNWNPTILAREGAAASVATGGGVFLTVGGIAGSLLFGIINIRVSAERLTTLYLVGGFAAALLFSATAAGDPMLLLACAALEGFFLVGAVVGLCALAAKAFPSEVRATGTGLGMATGRVGAMLGVSMGGALIGLGWSRPLYYTTLAVPALLAALIVWLLARHLRNLPGAEHRGGAAG